MSHDGQDNLGKDPEVQQVLQQVLDDHVREHGCLPSLMELVSEAERRLAADGLSLSPSEEESPHSPETDA